jgi:Selenocysteine synthase N terminal
MDQTTQNLLRALPSVEELISHASTTDLLAQYPRGQVVEGVRAAVEVARRAILAGAETG